MFSFPVCHYSSSVTPAVKAFLGSATDATNASTYTFTSQPFGTAAANRYIAVSIGSRANTAGYTITSVTIGGVSATQSVTATATSGGASTEVSSIWTALVPTGTTGTIVVNFSATMLRCGIGIWSMTGITGVSPTSTGTDLVPSGALSGVYSTTLTVPAGAVVLAAMWDAGLSGSGDSATWLAPLTKDFEIFPETTGNILSGASGSTGSSPAQVTITTIIADGYGALAAAVWSPL